MIFVGDWASSEPLRTSFGALSVGNLECAIADGEIASAKAYTSVLPESCIDNVRRAGFSALSLANNHVYDAGVDAFVSMRQNLERTCPDVQFFGTKDKPYAIVETDGKCIAVIGSLELCRSRGKDIFREEDVEALTREIRGRFDAV